MKLSHIGIYSFFALLFLVVFPLIYVPDVPDVNQAGAIGAEVLQPAGEAAPIVNPVSFEPESFIRVPQKDLVWPSRLTIDAIEMDAHIVPLSMNEKGEMAVPNGDSDDVGWYRYGTVPGEQGSAVFDAHVYAAFSQLHVVRPGDKIVVGMSDGTKRLFRVFASQDHALSDISADKLFNSNDGRYLHLITCAGAFSKKIGTYTHRRIVRARYIEAIPQQ